MKTDIEIAEAVTLLPIAEVAKKLGLTEDDIESYGKFKAKIDVPHLKNTKKTGKLILVTAVNPTQSGEGKTTVSIGLADSLAAIGASCCLALREPSLGPVFGIKGGATGGGMAQVAPMADINLHFTGDLHAITAANNLLSAMIDNHIYWGNALSIKRVVWKRCLDCNDRSLRNIVIGLSGNGVPREEGFVITAASEVMAVLCLASDMDDLKARLARIVIGYDDLDGPLRAGDLHADEAMAILLKDALRPNLVQTLEGVPAILHGGPFANIAHGCNTVIATRTALSHADYCITEAGFGADLGGEKFLDIKCRTAGLKPSCVVIVATVRALKSGGGAKKEDLSKPDAAALIKGLSNLAKHIENITKVFCLPALVTVNSFVTDTVEETQTVVDFCKSQNVPCVPCSIWEKGSEGGLELARAVKAVADKNAPKEPTYPYALSDPLDKKIESVAQKIYGADGVSFSPAAKKELAALEALGYGGLPVCIAKTQYSLSDNAALLGRPGGFTLAVKDIQLRAGAGFVVAVAGDMLLMPGLPKRPNAEGMTIADDTTIRGLF